MGKSADAPPVPDPNVTAAAQSASNVNTAAASAAMSRMNQFTPYGATTYQPSGSYTTPGGDTVPTYSQYTELSPMGQTILTGQQTVANNILPYAGTLASQAGAAATTPLDVNSNFSKTLQNPGNAGKMFEGALYDQVANAPGSIANLKTPFDETYNKGPDLLNKEASDAIYHQQAGFLDPQWGNQQKQLENQLSRQGIPVGSEAYNNAFQQFNNSKTQAYQSAQDSAIAGGSGAASNLFNMALAGRGQNLGQTETAANAALQAQNLTNSQQNQGFNQALSGQQQYLSQQQMAQQQPISLLQQLLGAAPATPSQPIATPVASPVAPTDVIGANASSTDAAYKGYQAKVAQNNATTGAVGSVAAAAVAAIAL